MNNRVEKVVLLNKISEEATRFVDGVFIVIGNEPIVEMARKQVWL